MALWLPQASLVTRVGERTLTLTNLDKVLFPSVGFTKAEVIDYYLRIAPVMLPHIRDRAMTRLRFPDGVGPDRSPFYEKNAPMGTPEWVRRVKVNTSDGIIDYIVVDDEAAVVWLANLAALEMHVPQWTVSSATPANGIISLPELQPRSGEPLANRLVVDLDPGAGMTIVDGARAALIVAGQTGRRRHDSDRADFGKQGHSGVRRNRADPQQDRLELCQAAQCLPAQGTAGLLRSGHVG
jgi:bifunctional non-homologous end joining protein LigD